MFINRKFWLVLSAFALSFQATAKTEMPFKSEKISTGLEVIAMESHKVPLVTIVLSFKAGAMTETKDIDGLTHLWEHMFFKGNARLKTQGEFRRRIRQLGITYNGDTASEKVRYFFTLPSSNLEAGLQFMADAISTPLLEQKELERERIVVLDEYDRNASRPGFKLSQISKKLIYGDQSHRRDPLGTRKTIETATRAQLLRIKKEVFVPNNAALLVSGDFQHKELIKLVNKYFSGWKTPKDWKMPTAPKFPKFPASTEIVFTHEQAQNVQVSVTYDGPKARTQQKDSFAADVLISLLYNRTSKFYKKFIDSGLTYGAGLSYYTQSQTGKITLYATTSPKNAKKVKKMLMAEAVEWSKPGYFTEDQLSDVRRSLLINYKREINKPSAYIKTMAFWWAITGLEYYEGYLDSLRNTSMAEVQNFPKKYLLSKPHITTYLLSPKDAKEAGLKDNSKTYLKKFNIVTGAH